MNRISCLLKKGLLRSALLAAFPVIAVSHSFSQTYNGGGGVIPDNGNTAVFTINVTGLSPSVIDTIHGLESVTLNVMHSCDGELRMELHSPDGEKILLTEGFGGDGDNFIGTVFKDNVPQSIFSGTAPFTGEYRPVENIGYLNNGQNGNGAWHLHILDMGPGGNAGTLLNWSLTFSSNPGTPFPFDSSNLAIIMIDTHGQEIPDDPKIRVGMKIIDNGTGNFNHRDDPPAYDYFAGIEIRGASSQMFMKKSYGLATWDSLGNSVDTALLGMPAESDWILNANYSDKTLMRNALSYQTWMNLGHYATRYRFVELFINGRYKGVYLFSEKIKRDVNRVDIAKLTPDMNTGDQLTGGYILKIDKQIGSGGDGFASRYPPPHNPFGQIIFFQYEYPKSDLITIPQKEYIELCIFLFESALDGPFFADTALGFRKYAIEDTFIDYFIENEFSKNVDGYRLSTFLHKERDSKGGKIRMGPVWDYDLAWHNANYCGGEEYWGWAFEFPCEYDYWQVPFWWQRLLEDTLYCNNLQCRWLEIRSSFLETQAVFNWIDSLAADLDAAQQRNFYCWPILGIYVWPNPYPYPQTYGEEIISLKHWIDLRLSWLDLYIPGTCWTLGTDEKDRSTCLAIFPNPAFDRIRVSGVAFSGEKVTAEICDVLGMRVSQTDLFQGQETIDIGG